VSFAFHPYHTTIHPSPIYDETYHTFAVSTLVSSSWSTPPMPNIYILPHLCWTQKTRWAVGRPCGALGARWGSTRCGSQWPSFGCLILLGGRMGCGPVVVLVQLLISCPQFLLMTSLSNFPVYWTSLYYLFPHVWKSWMYIYLYLEKHACEVVSLKLMIFWALCAVDDLRNVCSVEVVQGNT